MIINNPDTLTSNTPQDIQPIGNIDKLQQIIATLHKFIIDGNLQYGTELPSEKDLATALHVSRFSLREALRIAQVQGLIEISRGRKPRVAEPSAVAAAQMISLTLRRSQRTLLDLASVRLVLETYVAAEAAARVSDDDIDRLQKTVDIITAEAGNADICVAQDIEFHSILVKAAGNIVLEIMLAPLAQLLRETRRENIQYGVDPILQGHVAVLDAVRKHDSAAAAAAMRTHLELAKTNLQAILSKEGSGT